MEENDLHIWYQYLIKQSSAKAFQQIWSKPGIDCSSIMNPKRIWNIQCADNST